MCSAAARMMALPVGTEPVIDTMSASGLAASAAPTVAPSPLTRAQAPRGGRSASGDASQSSARRPQARGVTSELLTTTAQPARSAGASFRAMTKTGKFQGQMPTDTPTGSRCTEMCSFASSELTSSPS